MVNPILDPFSLVSKSYLVSLIPGLSEERS